MIAGLLAAVWLGCTPAPPVCPANAGTLDGTETGIPCAEARRAVPYIEYLAGRGLSADRRQAVLSSLRDVARREPDAVRTALAGASTVLEALDAEAGLEQALVRTRTAAAATADGGAFPRATFPGVARVIDEAVAVWERDEASGLVLTEMDVEGWIRYASLLREVQGGEPLHLSVADRVSMYRTVRSRWVEVGEDGKAALSSFGLFWPVIRNRWKAVPYETQQAWIGAAPLPPPMSGLSGEYLEAVTAGDPARHARILHEVLGPFRLDPP